MQKTSVFKILPRRFKSKYHVEEKVPSSGIYECSFCGNYTAFKKGELFAACEDCSKERQEANEWYVTNLVVHFMSKNLNLEFEKLANYQVRIADKITGFAGTMGFIYFHVAWFGFWVLANAGVFGRGNVFDPFPYGLLTMIVSLEAIFLTALVMISQNIQGQKAELRAEHDYQVNLKTEKEVAEILAMMREMKEELALQKKTEEEIVEQLKTQGKKPRKPRAGRRAGKKQEKILQEAGIEMVEH